MELADFMNGKNILPILGLNVFDTFLKVCETFSEWALDDISLANKLDSYRIWVCPVKSDKLQDVKSTIERYTSMKKLLEYYNKNIVENKSVSFFIKLDFVENKWVIEYGITDNRKLYTVGLFDYTVTTKLPDKQILKYLKEVLDDFNPREHLILYKVRKECYNFNPGYCTILEPILMEKQIIINTYNLGIWNENKLANGEGKKYLEIFKNWVATHKWCNLVKMIVRPGNNKTIQFILELR